MSKEKDFLESLIGEFSLDNVRRVRSESDFISVPIVESMLQKALSKSKDMGTLNNSIRRGAGNVVGFLGEIAFTEIFPASKSSNSYDWDIKAGNFTVEAKTKDRTVSPKIKYECSIANFNTTQKTDFYVFVSLLRSGSIYTNAYLLGFIQKEEYMKKSIFLKEGQIDPSNGWKVNADCWNLPINELNSFVQEIRW
jgi:hypothetical protein